MEKVRVRFAPSPTGPLHLGGMRTALYNYLFAKGRKGDFILRIEDTDTERFVQGAEEYINEALEWAGIIPDESPQKGGAYAPYRQSDRRKIYDRYKDLILESDYAYLAFDSEDELQNIRKKTEEKGKIFSYNHETRDFLRNSISLSKEEVQRLLDEKVPHVIRFKMPFNQTIVLEDMIRGTFSVNTNTLDDKVLVKSDGMPTYHFANIVDDHEMKITHVIRGEEWLSSMPLHVLLYRAINREAPKFAHLPLILKPEGKGKLSKRDGDKYNFPVFPISFKDPLTGKISTGYREEGFFPDAFVNMLALLGWSPKNDQEFLSMEEMLREFELNRVQKSGARFSLDKAKWFNQEYIRKKGDKEILPDLKRILFEKNINIEDEKLLKIISLMKERVVFVRDIYRDGIFFFEAPSEYSEKAIKKAWKSDTSQVLAEISEKLASIIFDAEGIKETLRLFLEEHAMVTGKLMMPLRLALTGDLKGPETADLMSIIGKEETFSRINKAIEILK